MGKHVPTTLPGLDILTRLEIWKLGYWGLWLDWDGDCIVDDEELMGGLIDFRLGVSKVTVRSLLPAACKYRSEAEPHRVPQLHPGLD